MYNEYAGKDMFEVMSPMVKQAGLASFDITQYSNLKGLLCCIGTEHFDYDRFHNSAMGEHFYKLYQLVLRYKHGMDKNVIDFWYNYGKGLVKELHDTDTGTPWYSYTPKSAFLPENKDRKYPVIMQLNVKPDLIAEAYGHAFVCAEDEVILVVQYDDPNDPDARQRKGKYLTGRRIPSLNEDILPIVQRALDALPADRSRVYMTGFGLPGFLTTAFIFEHPELLAGVMLNAQLLYMMWDLPAEEQIARPIATKMPIINIGGVLDWVRPFPVNIEYETKMNNGHNNRTIEKSISRPKMWYRINDCPPYTMEEALEVADYREDRKAQKYIGVRGTNSATVIMDDAEHYFVDVASKDGIIRTRFIAAENCGHWMYGTYARLQWDFIKHFSRDPVTHESIFDGITEPFYNPRAEV